MTVSRSQPSKEKPKPDAQTQQHLGQDHVNPGMSGKPGEKVDYSPDIPEGK